MAKKKKTNTFGTSVNVRVSQTLHDKIFEEAERTASSMGTVVRQAVLSYFEKRNENEKV